jgi:DNA modification methylase
MSSFHKLIHGDSREIISQIPKGSVDLIITSPPYPMVEMWDESFALQNPLIKKALKNGNGSLAFELMHAELNKVWENLKKIVKPGGIACINIGDATRTVEKEFKLYSNHTKITGQFLKSGFSNLPNILWRKQTNSPNKFMGSGMLPPGAYVTLEHEYILIFRKGRKREFNSIKEKENRNRSAFFWEERNNWFSDLWDFKGISQKMNNGVRNRSGAFPFELAYRLINMFSVKGDLIYDPFLGLGTTTFAGIASNRNTIGVEIEKGLINRIMNTSIQNLKTEINTFIEGRLKKHLGFVEMKEKVGGKKYFKYLNSNYGFPVMTKQEIKFLINFVKKINLTENGFISEYFDEPLLELPI